ncbi:hypothetical protein [uncultured Sphaerotilus sp.]|uniref:hypothetical protein n=1 Tax=uncultured Sphaerotilus sp. TaxID=474984 RepID=UPI0030CA2E54
MKRLFLAVAAAAAALLAGCGGGDDTNPDASIVLLTDRPAVALALANAMPGHDVVVQAAPAASAAASVAAWAARGAGTVVAHYTPGTEQSVCQEAQRLGIRCVVTDPPEPATYYGETYCDLAWLDGAEAQGQFLARCLRIEAASPLRPERRAGPVRIEGGAL